MEEQKKVSIRLVTLILIVLIIIAAIVGIVFAVKYFNKEENTNNVNDEIYSAYFDRGAHTI